MKINLQHLALALFWGMARTYLDKETGKIIDEKDMTDLMKDDHDQFEEIEQYTEIYIRQQYMEKMFAENVIQDLEGLSSYPRFAMRKLDDPISKAELEIEYQYQKKAHQLCERFAMEHTGYDPPDFVREHETYADFEEYFRLEFAKQWCQKHGYAYY